MYELSNSALPLEHLWWNHGVVGPEAGRLQNLGDAWYWPALNQIEVVVAIKGKIDAHPLTSRRWLRT